MFRRIVNESSWTVVKGTYSTLSIFGIEICKSATSYTEFCEMMKLNEKEFVVSLNMNEYENIEE